MALLLGCLAVGAALALAVFLLASRTADGTGATGSTVVVRAPALTKPSTPPDVDALYRRFGALARRVTPSDYARRLQRRLDRAGNPGTWPPERVLALKGIGLVAGLLLGTLYGFRLGGILVVAAPVAAVAACFYLPDIWIRNLGERRQVEIRNGLPDVIDMMTVCVEAGLGFDAALSRVGRSLDGPAAQEFVRVLQEMQVGKSRTEALRAVSERTDVLEVRTFVSSMIQSAELGISVGDVLRAQADQMRVTRRQRAEERAQKLPVKILLPLVFCILPAMFAVILGPAVLHIVEVFSGGM